MSRAKEITVLISDAETEQALGDVLRSHRSTDRNVVRVLVPNGARKKAIWREGNYIVLASVNRLVDIAQVATMANRRNQLKGLLIREEGACTTNDVLQHMMDARLHILRNTLVHKGLDVPRRVVAAWKTGLQGQTIADAYVVDNTITVFDCGLKRYQLGFGDIGVLARIEETERTRFEVDEDGSFIYWPAGDVHLNIDMIREALEPEYRAGRLKESTAEYKQLGRAIAFVRKSKGLRQSDFEGLSERQLRRLEGGSPITENAMRILAAGHDMKLKVYLDEIAHAIHNAQA